MFIIIVGIVVTLILTLASGFFSMSEMAVVNAKRPLLEQRIQEQHDMRAQKALDLSLDPGEVLATIQIAITLLGFFSSVLAASCLSKPFASWMGTLGMSIEFAEVLAPIIITVIVSYASIVVGELVPKRLGLADAERIAIRIAPFMAAFNKILKPLIWVTSKSANGLCRLLHIKNVDERMNTSEDEIRYMVSDAEELTEEEKSMIHEIFDLGDTVAREVMVPRVDMTALPESATVHEVMDEMRRTGYSRIPIYRDEVDKIVGIAHIKDLISPLVDEDAGGKPISGFIRAANFVPESKDIIPLLSEMQTGHDQMVVVVDEYGGTSGIITIEDIVEEVVGEIEDEFDPDNKYLTKLGEREWLVDGRYSIDDAHELGWPVEDSDEYETIAGFVLDVADGLPRPGQVFEKAGWTFRVQSMRGRRIALLRVVAPEPRESESASDSSLEQSDAQQ